MSSTAIDSPTGAPPPIGEGVRLTYDSLHDLVSPINQISSLTNLLVKQYGERLGPEAADLIGLVEGSVARLQKLLTGFRTYVQVAGKESNFQFCEGNTLVSDALASLNTAIEQSGASVSYDRLPDLYCDPAQIVYLLVSLVENSIKFRSQVAPEIHISASSNADSAILSVRDNGIGIDEKNHRRIFEMFKRVHNDQYPGPGVGLAIAERIVERHGGKIWVESKLGQGSTFFVALPRSTGSPPTRGTA
ncbi:MAG TPA: ATP-binding protein [Bryobacteraceae bacterium]|nr:ATP-binding protein [Bryobacteraceae bacterium]